MANCNELLNLVSLNSLTQLLTYLRSKKNKKLLDQTEQRSVVIEKDSF